MTAKVTCRDCADFLADYLADELAADVRRTFEQHLGRCRNCRAYLDRYSAAIAAGKSACAHEDEEAADAFPEDLVEAILAAQKRQA